MLLFIHMKNTLLVPVVFISNILVWLCLFSFFSQLCSYDSLRTLSAGICLPFCIDLLGRALYLFPFALMCAMITTFLFLMRHTSIVFVSIPLVLLLTGLSVLFAVPFSYNLSARYSVFAGLSGTESRSAAASAGAELHAPGYIRSYDGDSRVIWYSDSGDLVSPVVVARDSAGPGGNALAVYPSARYSPETGTLSAGTTVFAENAGGRDPLLASSLELPPYLSSAASDTVRVLDAFRSARERSLSGYLAVAGSFFAAITALWILAYATGWRLLNMLLIVAGFRLLLAAYPHTTAGRVYSLVRRFLPASVDSALVSPALFAALAALISAVALVFLVKKLVSRRSREAFHD